YIADTFNNALRELDLGSHEVRTVATSLKRPLAAAALSPDTLLVSECNGNRIDTVHLPDGRVTPWSITGLQAPNTKTCPTR
ncbi:MAG: hypothetical protein ACREPZ_01940, partial [Rhodanobacteraceae bacterium]